jgi:hypothetical protein
MSYILERVTGQPSNCVINSNILAVLPKKAFHSSASVNERIRKHDLFQYGKPKREFESWQAIGSNGFLSRAPLRGDGTFSRRRLGKLGN